MLIDQYDPLKKEILKVLDKDGNCREEFKPSLSNDELKDIFRIMIFVRLVDQKALSMQRQGRMGTYAPVLGQEASQIGSAKALKEGDWLVPSYRETAALIARGIPLRNVFLFWMGHEMGNNWDVKFRALPMSVPVGTQALHAVGLAWAAKLRKKREASLVYFGDGATSTGDVHEAMNFAGVFHVPVVFFCQNNQYAISVPRRMQCAAVTLAQKAYGYGYHGLQVDGNDFFAVFLAVNEALEKARSGGGPTFIESITYRLGPHTTSDDPSRYREEKELEMWKPLDPLVRFRFYLKKTGLWTTEWEDKITEECRTEIEQEVTEAENTPPPKPEEIFEYSLAHLTADLEEQREDLLSAVKEKGE